MRTLIVLIACSLIVVSTNNAFAQDKAKKAVQGWTTGEYWSPIYCDGEEIDLLEGGELRVHYVYRLKPFVYFKEIDQLKGEVTSSVTGEFFKVRETDKLKNTPNSYMVTWRYNLIGNNGTHYHGTLTMNMRTGKIIIGKTVCH